MRALVLPRIAESGESDRKIERVHSKKNDKLFNLDSLGILMSLALAESGIQWFTNVNFINW